MYYKKESIICSNLPTFKSEIERLCPCIIHCDILSDIVFVAIYCDESFASDNL